MSATKIPFDCPGIELSIVDKFEKIAREFWDKEAIRSNGTSLTYQILNEQSNKLARCIHALSSRDSRVESKSNNHVGILFEHDKDMVIGIMGVLKSKNAYVPLDPNIPIERNIYIINDAKPTVLVTNNKNKILAESMKNLITNIDLFIINIDDLESYSSVESSLKPESTDNAYLLYTSGSTGLPKGVIQNHRNVMHFIQVYSKNLNIKPIDRVSLLSSYCFDASIMDIFSALLCGSTLCIYNIKNEGRIDKFYKWLQDEEISVLHTIPTFYRYFTQSLSNESRFPYLRLVVLGGEMVLKNDLETYKNFFGDNCLFVNGLGPTESTVTLQYFLNKHSEITSNSVPVGYPVDHTEVYILNELGVVAKTYEVGEIIYKSDYLALGYWNDQSLTESMFGVDPLTGSGRIYRSGDMGRYLPNGAIEFVGRKNYEIKIRGHKIDNREIENAILSFSGIENTVVISKKYHSHAEDYYLIAFVLCNNCISINELNHYLRNMLPDYMVPSRIINLEKFPVTSSGKIDRKAMMNQEVPERKNEFVYPRTILEEKLADMWSEILEVPNIGVNDNFFDLGGHSLKATLLTAKIYKDMSIDLPIIEIFNNPTISDLAISLNNMDLEKYIAIQSLEKSEYYDTSSAQKRMYILNRFYKENTSYNITEVVKIIGDLDLNKLEMALLSLVERHESLRTSFEFLNGNVVQFIHENIKLQLDYFHTIEKDLDQVIENLIVPFDLKNPPLFRASIIGIDEITHILLLDMHHIVSDGVSVDIIIQEIMAFYNDWELKELKIQYKDFSKWQIEMQKSAKFKKQEEYWLSKYSDTIELTELQLPYDFSNFDFQDFKGDQILFKIDNLISNNLDILSKNKDCTLYITLLAAFFILLYRYTGQEDIVVGTPIAGRNMIETERMVGMFVNTLALRNKIAENKQFIDFLSEVRSNTLNAIYNQDYPFEMLIDAINAKRNIGKNPLFNTMFAHQTVNRYRNTNGGNVQFIPYNIKCFDSTFEISFTVLDEEGKLTLSVEYRKNLFKKNTIKKMIRSYIYILKLILKKPEIELKEIVRFCNRDVPINV
ncbi:amino acid adenylation domain-containing protein [Brevibacillus reuszeri]|uniref:amino acid adenylation domain-containing protein n=1 Tax=Brevibacillus reuszeri TaxID=54915 RepID=UPI003D1E5750